MGFEFSRNSELYDFTRNWHATLHAQNASNRPCMESHAWSVMCGGTTDTFHTTHSKHAAAMPKSMYIQQSQLTYLSTMQNSHHLNAEMQAVPKSCTSSYHSASSTCHYASGSSVTCCGGSSSMTTVDSRCNWAVSSLIFSFIRQPIVEHLPEYHLQLASHPGLRRFSSGPQSCHPKPGDLPGQ